MAIIGRSPMVSKLVGVSCYIFGIIIMITNIYYSFGYFSKSLNPGGGELSSLQWWSCLAISGAMGAFEAVVIGFVTTPSAWGFIFTIPDKLARIQNENQREIAKSATIVFSIFLAILVLVVYYVDYNTTILGLGIEDQTAARFLAASLVFGSEILFVGGNATLWIALISDTEDQELKEKLKQARA